jgi:integrase
MGRIAVSAGGSSDDGVKVVHHRLRHGSAMTTRDTYGYLWPDSDESARAAAGAVLAARADSLWTSSALLRQSRR